MANDNFSDIDRFRDKFIEIVARHIRQELDQTELENLTAQAQCNIPHTPGLHFEAFDSIENRVRHLAFEEAISPLEMLSVPYFFQRLQIIGQLHDRPVCYFKGCGIYLWSLEPDGDSLSFWLSYPAYPPGWPQSEIDSFQTMLEIEKAPNSHPLPC
ncbi:hypothetical protein [Chromobacterium sp. IIBBL 290-4]|uniref:hypothetical protein n=1 Tax=Chromobacterium sp. IIBBL 290-4 TaxID=2953890 RepID=UPI0020B7FA10|nr:hypothetical protein [Chromobacterium sp. IIBBL 290-4]UTH75558.1 hypothetical protein NKT35_05530 [Chromobacterium sp. IIBBL 290-4]